jgi:hypothetical protein
VNHLDIVPRALPNNRADHAGLSVIVVCERDNNESASYTSMKHDMTPSALNSMIVG